MKRMSTSRLRTLLLQRMQRAIRAEAKILWTWRPAVDYQFLARKSTRICGRLYHSKFVPRSSTNWARPAGLPVNGLITAHAASTFFGMAQCHLWSLLSAAFVCHTYRSCAFSGNATRSSSSRSALISIASRVWVPLRWRRSDILESRNRLQEPSQSPSYSPSEFFQEIHWLLLARQ